MSNLFLRCLKFHILTLTFLIYLNCGDTEADKIELDRGEYCAAFNVNYEYYCHGIWTAEKLSKVSRHYETIRAFCPNYRAACINEHHHGSKQHRHHSVEESEEEDGSQPRKINQNMLRRMYTGEIIQRLEALEPCTPSCRAPHCTRECKCRYDIPEMKEWCLPKPRWPSFEMTCNIWLGRCAPYLSD
ncbi:hypothetical protein WR25_18400 isoform A [Diploscapter pachys]|uniref:Uncharacterized protein n=1 Tax=Diploscapter pachys TaxID=2018661 RepID=A0A2A2JZK0_9BILA|nr:hypothetical protein WR25_18400 isoform A [Diploscapter pachys]